MDRLTGEAVPVASLEVGAGDARLQVDPEDPGALGEVRRFLAAAAGPASWRYKAPWLPGGERLFEIPCSEAPVEEDGRVLLPWQSGVRGSVTLAGPGAPPALATTVRVHVFHVAAVQAARRRAAARGGLPPRAGEDLLVFSRVYQLEPAVTRETSTTANGRYELALPAEGPAFVEVRREGYASMDLPLTLVPGQWVQRDLVLRPRPVLAGTVSGPDGAPLPGTPVTVGVHYDSVGEVDLSPEDGLGHTLRWDSSGAILNASRQVVTDAGGSYRVEVPVARAYSLLAIEGDAFGFALLEAPVPDAEGRIRLDLRLRRPTPEEADKVLQLRWADGSPVTGVEVQLGIADDPYGRQFPALHPDAEGRVPIPWREPGVRHGFFLTGPALTGPHAGWLEPGQWELRVPLDLKAGG